MRRLRTRVLYLALALHGLVGPALADPFPKHYDRSIEEACETWLPMWDWRWLKAQYWQESRLDPNARSPVGAEGVGQFMPGTWGDVPASVRLGVVDRRAADPSIRAGAWYMARLRKGWSAPRPESERRRLAQASYNAGMGSILKAQKSCNGAPDWPTIAACLPRITGHHSKETIGYVNAIEKHFRRML